MNPVAQSVADRPIRVLLRWRWPVALIGSATGIGLALMDHYWEVGHGVPDLASFDFVAECLIYGLLAPFGAWLLLTMLARDMARRVGAENRAERHQYFTRQLSQVQEWDDLTRCVTQSLGSLLQLDHVSLFTYDHQRAQLDFVTAWNATGRLSPPSILPHLHYDDDLARTGLHAHSGLAVIALAADGHSNASDYCLPLSCNNLLAGVIRLRLQAGQVLPRPDAEFIEAVAPEMALALVHGIARPREIALIRTQTQAAERRQLAYDLHASLTQQIGYLHFSLDRLSADNRFDSDRSAQRELEHMRKVGEELYDRMRDYLDVLHAGERTDLAHLIDAHARKVAHYAAFQIEFTTTGDVGQLPPQISRAIFGLAQEALNNVERHAQAKLVRIGLSCSSAGVVLTVADDGVGFLPVDSLPPEHKGLLMMRECAQELDGELEIKSAQMQGTSLEFRIPLREALTMASVSE